MNGCQESQMLGVAPVVNPIISIGSKKCTKCGTIKKLEEYHRDKTKKDGHELRCRRCKSAAGKEKILLRGPVPKKITKKKGGYSKCATCGEEIYRSKYRAGKAKKNYCSYLCMGKGMETKKIIFCDYCGKEYMAYPSQIKGNEKKLWHHYCSQKCKGMDRRGRNAGSKHYLWNGGSSRDYKTGYNSVEYRKWRVKVFERDKYICQHCGVEGGELNAHHIFGFTNFKEFRYSIDNGATLCVGCHNKTKDGAHKSRLIIFASAETF